MAAEPNVRYYDGTLRGVDDAAGSGARFALCSLDAYVPRQPGPGLPMVVFIHGGTWRTGSKRAPMYSGSVGSLPERGCVAVSVEYRRTRMPWPVFLFMYPLFPFVLSLLPLGLLCAPFCVSGELAWWTPAALAGVAAAAYVLYWLLYPPGANNLVSQFAPGQGVRWHQMAADVARAVRWARDNAERLGADPSRLCLVGHSAGGHLASLLSTDPRHLAAVGMSLSDVSVTVSVSGVHDIGVLRDGLSRVLWAFVRVTAVQWAFGAAGEWGDASCVAAAERLRCVPGAKPRFVLLAGAGESEVFRTSMTVFARALEHSGAAVVERVVPKLNHNGMIKGLGSARDPVGDALFAELSK
eukprot:TRINITY_DN12798_c0_g1_i1.p1 TRINITY_DN12798_c0_g1~~TRINITY_DN12798_c0_g1_i1.p1  ORF type:complete len:373 (+),score=128.46 TRINITY_DN12798_c0_g1_i1:59-1120(+)